MYEWVEIMHLRMCHACIAFCLHQETQTNNKYYKYTFLADLSGDFLPSIAQGINPLSVAIVEYEVVLDECGVALFYWLHGELYTDLILPAMPRHMLPVVIALYPASYIES